MIKRTGGLRRKVLGFLLVLWLCLLSLPTPLRAQPFYPLPSTHSLFTLSLQHHEHLAFLRWLFGGRKNDDGEPANTRSAGRRGKCSEVGQRLIGLVPPVEPLPESSDPSLPSTEVQSFLGLTTEEFPTLWVHIPPLPDDVKALEFMIQDAQNVDGIATPIPIPLTTLSGIYPIHWAVSGIPLALDTPYHWYVSILCNADRPSRNPSIDAWVQRVSLTPAIATQFSSIADLREQVDLYIEDGIWQDALTQLAKLRCQFPEDTGLAEDWRSLLVSIGVEAEVAIAPIRQCPT